MPRLQLRQAGLAFDSGQYRQRYTMIRAILLLSGMIIGAGMFAIPFSFAQTGFWLGAVELGILSLVVLGLHLLYGEIVLATPSFHRMPGYVRTHLGRPAAAVSWLSSLFGTAGTLLAYLVVDSIFLRTIFQNAAPSGAAFWIVIMIAAAVGIITFFPLKKEAGINGVLTIFEIGFLIFVSVLLVKHISPAHLSGVRAENFFVPYGVLLFALSGASVVPDLVTVLGRNKKKVRAAIIIGSVIPALLYFFFAYAVVGVNGPGTSEEAIAGLQRFLGGRIALWGSIAGFLAVFTSFVALSANFQAMLRLDLGMRRRSAWLAASAMPLALYLAGFQDFIAIISAVGIFAFGIDGILFFLMSRKIQKDRGRRSAAAAIAGFAILAVIIIGVLAELVQIF